jgi:PAS domain S-box-containing protein
MLCLKPAVKIALIYLSCGLLWILLSDRLLSAICRKNEALLTQMQTYKGFFFVAFTSMLLYLLVKRFYRNISNEIQKLEVANKALEESEKRYGDLFRLSPLPLWVYDCATLRFLTVNEAAVTQYGYSKEEFLSKTIVDIRPPEEIPRLMDVVKSVGADGKFALRGVFRHLKKNGEIVTVEIRSNDIIYKGLKAKVVLVNDITERLNYTTAIERQNSKLHEIAYMQSHVVRAPLATLMGFIHLLEDCSLPEEEKEEIHENILRSASELDNVIKNISSMANEVTA